MKAVLFQLLSRVRLFATLPTVAARPFYPPNFPGKTGVGCHFLLQGIFPTQEQNLHLLYWKVDSLPLSHQQYLTHFNTSTPSLVLTVEQDGQGCTARKPVLSCLVMQVRDGGAQSGQILVLLLRQRLLVLVLQKDWILNMREKDWF